MIDIHAHILPGLDDGADRTATSLRMAEIALRSGVTDLIATPHANQRRRFENYCSPALDASFERLRDALEREGIGLRLHLGMEVFATEDLAKLFRAGKFRTLAGSRYFLMEFGFQDDVYFMDRVLRDMLDEGVTPILAHPERYRGLQALPDILCDWVRLGVHMQINKGSLTGYFGRESHALAVTMIRHDLVSFAASDAHRADRRTPVLSDARQWLSAHVSERYAYRLLRENPARVLRDEPLIECDPVDFCGS